MKFTLSWLKEHLETTASLKEITDKLTAIGLELEGVEDRAEALKAFTVAKILETSRHPEADKLQICKVESDVGILQIVCGAANARAGLFVCLAKEGMVIPANGMVIKKAKVRGVESFGMLCSLEELGLADSSDGIVELPESQIGASVAEVLGLNDPVIDIAITPNRADCLGVRGVARDLAAAGMGTLKALGNGQEGLGNRTTHASSLLPIIETANCLQFVGCHISGVKNGESPAWLKKRLEAIGQKSISALVDITNYFTIDLCRPLHVYDGSKISGNLIVREAKSVEKIVALNGKEYDLPEGATIIADAQKPLAIGGIIGGAESGCVRETTDVFLEVALFNPENIAQTGRKLQIDSDARYRFERGVDVAFVEEAANRAVALIIELCGGQASELVYAGKTPDYKREIAFNPRQVLSIGGVDIAPEKSINILNSLGFTLVPNSSSLIPPSWRADIHGETDLVEEILRIYGYEHIPSTPLPKISSITPTALKLPQKRERIAKRLLATRGMLEVQTWSFMPEAWAEMFGGAKPELKLLNPISADLSDMRPSILPNLLDAAKRNAARGFKDTSLFEVGLQFHDITPTGQKTVACGVRVGKVSEQAYNADLFSVKNRTADAMDAKADALAILQNLGLSKAEISTQNLPAYYHPNRSGALVLGKNVLGYFGEIHPAIAAKFDIEEKVAAFEIFLDAIPQARAKGTAKPQLKLSDFQAVERDFAFIVDAGINAADIIKEINKAEKNLVTDVQIFDVYVGKGVDAGKKSVAVKVCLQSYERTLAEADISAVSSVIIQGIGKAFGGVLRQ